MRKSYLRSETDTPRDLIGLGALRTDRPVAVYYRQSTDAQVGNISTLIQTVDMCVYLKQLGWTEEKIILIDIDQGVSGTKKIDERRGMRWLFELITEGKVGAVACQDEDRLFRDVTQVQVSVFIEACKVSQVAVITPGMIYDFSNLQAGTSHARQFSFKCQVAAEFINAVIKGKLQNAKRRLAIGGCWAGAAIPTGYMVDVRRSLPDGSENANHRRFVPFAPYAEVINRYFELFLRYGGNIHATISHIQDRGPWYPDPTLCKPPEGYKAPYRLRRYDRGYCPGNQGLVGLLTNVAYIGHWAVGGIVVRWNNHPPIVPVDVFMQAYNSLSEVDFGGFPNRQYQPFCEHSQPTREVEHSSERPLCSGLIISEFHRKWCTVSTEWVSSKAYYVYRFNPSHPISERIWTRKAIFVDNTVMDLVRSKLIASLDAPKWEDVIMGLATQEVNTQKFLQAQIANLKNVMQTELDRSTVLSSPHAITALETRYGDAETELSRLITKLQALKRRAEDAETLRNLRRTCGPALAGLRNLASDTRRALLGFIVKRIEAYPIQHRDLRLIVIWWDDSLNEIVLPRLNRNGEPCWRLSETSQLLKLIDGGAPQLQISEAFYARTWDNIRDKIIRCRGAGAYKPRPKPVKDYETYLDYLERTGGEQTINENPELRT